MPSRPNGKNSGPSPVIVRPAALHPVLNPIGFISLLAHGIIQVSQSHPFTGTKGHFTAPACLLYVKVYLSVALCGTPGPLLALCAWFYLSDAKCLVLVILQYLQQGIPLFPRGWIGGNQTSLWRTVFPKTWSEDHLCQNCPGNLVKCLYHVASHHPRPTETLWG